MEEARARALVSAECEHVMELLALAVGARTEDVRAQFEAGAGDSDAAQPLEHGAVNGAIVDSLRERLAGLKRAERRIAEGTYGTSILSGDPIPEGRLEAEPAAEYTIAEAAQFQHKHR